MRTSPGNPLGPTVELSELNVPGVSQGAIIYRNATAWSFLAPGTAGTALVTGGAGANPAWGGGAISVSTLSDATEYSSGAGVFTDTVLKTFTFTAPADCIVLGFAYAGDQRNTVGSGNVNILEANDGNIRTATMSTPGDNTYARRGICCNHFLTSVGVGTSESKYFMLNGATKAYQVLATQSNVGAVTSVRNQKLLVIYAAV